MLTKKELILMNILVGVCLGGVLLPFVAVISGQMSFSELFIQHSVLIICYLACGLTLYRYWARLDLWLKGALAALPIQYALLVIVHYLCVILHNHKLVHLEFGLSETAYWLFNPFEYFYVFLFISNRAVDIPHGFALEILVWEKALVLPVLRLFYPWVLGGLVGSYLLQKKPSGESSEQGKDKGGDPS